jgi:hypothetical protein
MPVRFAPYQNQIDPKNFMFGTSYLQGRAMRVAFDAEQEQLKMEREAHVQRLMMGKINAQLGLMNAQTAQQNAQLSRQRLAETIRHNKAVEANKGTDLELKVVKDPTTGKPKYVPEDEAVGMEAYYKETAVGQPGVGKEAAKIMQKMLEINPATGEQYGFAGLTQAEKDVLDMWQRVDAIDQLIRDLTAAPAD